jgi:hypothetical protein
MVARCRSLMLMAWDGLTWYLEFGVDQMLPRRYYIKDIQG